MAPKNDLQGVKVYNAVDLEGLYTLGTVVVDYRGYRVTAQSIIPGKAIYLRLADNIHFDSNVIQPCVGFCPQLLYRVV